MDSTYYLVIVLSIPVVLIAALLLLGNAWRREYSRGRVRGRGYGVAMGAVGGDGGGGGVACGDGGGGGCG